MIGEYYKEINGIVDNAQKKKSKFASYNENMKFTCNVYVYEL